MVNAGPIDDYMGALRRALRGPGGVRRDLLTEAHDSLLDAAEAYECEGLSRVEAERLAVADFGTVREIAPDFQRELAVSQGRRTAALLFLSVPLTTLAWSVLWRIFPETTWMEQVKPAWFGLLSRSVDLIQLGVGVLGGLALLALGRGARRIRRPDLLIRGLGVFVWIMTPLIGAMGLTLAAAARDPIGFTAYVPGLVVSLLNYVLSAWQLSSAARCLRCTSAPDVTEGDPERSLSRS